MTSFLPNDPSTKYTSDVIPTPPERIRTPVQLVIEIFEVAPGEFYEHIQLEGHGISSGSGTTSRYASITEARNAAVQRLMRGIIRGS